MEILANLGITGVGIIASVWIVRHFFLNKIKHDFDVKLETLKSEQRLQTETELIKWQNQLNVLASQDGVKFKYGFEKTAETINSINLLAHDYKNLVYDLLNKMNRDVSAEGLEALSLARAKRQEFWNYLSRNALYLPPELSEVSWDLYVTLYQLSILRIDFQDASADDILNLRDTYEAKYKEYTALCQKHLGVIGAKKDSKKV